MTHDDDLGHGQLADGKFNSGRGSVIAPTLLEWRYQRGNVAHHE